MLFTVSDEYLGLTYYDFGLKMGNMAVRTKEELMAPTKMITWV